MHALTPRQWPNLDQKTEPILVPHIPNQALHPPPIIRIRRPHSLCPPPPPPRRLLSQPRLMLKRPPPRLLKTNSLMLPKLQLPRGVEPYDAEAERGFQRKAWAGGGARHGGARGGMLRGWVMVAGLFV